MDAVGARGILPEQLVVPGRERLVIGAPLPVGVRQVAATHDDRRAVAGRRPRLDPPIPCLSGVREKRVEVEQAGDVRFVANDWLCFTRGLMDLDRAVVPGRIRVGCRRCMQREAGQRECHELDQDSNQEHARSRPARPRKRSSHRTDLLDAPIHSGRSAGAPPGSRLGRPEARAVTL